jgi:outer membrane protein OmpA-like peptidoglycan-associated protein
MHTNENSIQRSREHSFREIFCQSYHSLKLISRFLLLGRTPFSAVTFVFFATGAQANVIGADTQNFNPTTTGIDFITVQSSQTLTQGYINFGGFLDYAINALPNYVNTVTQTRSQSKDQLLSSDVHMGFGLTKNWDFGFNFQSVLSQNVEVDVLKAVYIAKGLTDARLYTKYRLFGDRAGGLALIGTVNFPLVENNPFFGNSSKPIYNFDIAADTSKGNWAFGINLGFRLRNPGDKIGGATNPIDPIGNMYTGSVAAAYIMPSIHWSLISEIYSSFPVKGTASQTDRDLSSNELLFSGKYWGWKQTAVYTGIATGITRGTFTPDWRVFIGFNYLIGQYWGKDKAPAKVVEPAAPVIEISEPAAAPTPMPTPEATPVPVAVTEPVIMSASNTKALDIAPVAGRQKVVVQGVRFKSNSDRVEGVFKNYLAKFAKYLQRPPEFQNLQIFGHTDSQGSAELNTSLSERRAAQVKEILVKVYGLPADKISTKGLGPSVPISDNSDEFGRAQNRRVEFEIDR